MAHRQSPQQAREPSPGPHHPRQERPTAAAPGPPSPLLGAASDEWLSRQQTIQEEANRRRSEAAKGRQRKSDGTLASGSTSSGRTGGGTESPTLQAKAAASKTNRGAVEHAAGHPTFGNSAVCWENAIFEARIARRSWFPRIRAGGYFGTWFRRYRAGAISGPPVGIAGFWPGVF